MKESLRKNACRNGKWVGATLFGGGILATVVLATVIVAVSCTTAPTPFIVSGPGQTGNEPPSLNILQPVTDLTVSQGQVFVIRWTDTDRDSNALISYFLVNTVTGRAVTLIEGIEENDSSGPDSVSVGTSLVPVGLYNLRGVINDGTTRVEVLAQTTGTPTPRAIVINVTEPGQGPLTQPPRAFVTEPAFNLSVTQDDVVRISVQPTALPPAMNLPFDGDSDMTLFIVLDVDLDPNNDDPANEIPNSIEDGIIVLRRQVVPQGSSAALPFDIVVDLNLVPPRSGGEPYFIRATVTDANNPAVHHYASGRINVVGLAAGLVDLAEIGRTRAGARFYGFNPGAQTGSSMTTISDFDNDGIADFVIVARFGNPRNFGLLGEAYLVYGRDRLRFGGAIPVNSISQTISGVIFEAPPVRDVAGGLPLPGQPYSEGITSISFIRDITADGRPDILIGLPRTFGMVDTMDYDPGDEAPTADATEDVAVLIRQGQAEVRVGDVLQSISTYNGTSDLVISTAAPNTVTGSSTDLTWQDNPAGNVREWALLKFANVLDIIPNANEPELIVSGSVQANLIVRVFNTGGPATVHLCLTNFTEQTTLNTFGDGGAPVAGVDYEVDPIGTVDAAAAEEITVNISALVVDLLNGILQPLNNEIRLIIVPSATEGQNQAGIRSSEVPSITLRPTLDIQYTRTNVFGAQGCYPDPWVNNKTDVIDTDTDLQFFSGGAVVQFNSQNRDSRSVTGINTTRLESTVVALELVGQEGFWFWDEGGVAAGSGTILTRASNEFADNLGNETAEPQRISGARFTSGWYDYYDHLFLRQGPREDLFGQTVASIGDLNNDGLDEIVISAPRNERYNRDLQEALGFQSTHLNSTAFTGSIVVIPGFNYNNVWREKAEGGNSTSNIPVMDQYRFPPFGSCSNGVPRHGPLDNGIPPDAFEIFAEDIDDFLGGAVSAGDFNLDGVPDILCGAPRNKRSGMTDTGATYILYGRNVLGSYRLANADSPLLRPPMLRIRGVTNGDQIGWRQTTGLDVNGDRLDDVFISSPWTDFGGISRGSCAADFNGDGIIDGTDLNSSTFNSCRQRFASEDLFSDDACKAFDYDFDFDIDDDDRTVFDCLVNGGANCCAGLANNGFVGIIFGGVFTDGDRDITQIATNDLPGTKFFGSGVGHRAGFDISSAGDFNQDGFGDLLITVPGEIRVDSAGRERLGVVYMIFGGTHLENRTFNLAEVGTSDLPGIVFFSPYVRGRPHEAAPLTVAFLGDVNNDGFGDIGIGNQNADFIDLRFPQGPDAPGTDAQVGRRRNAGDMYLIYGNNFGTNRGSP